MAQLVGEQAQLLLVGVVHFEADHPSYEVAWWAFEVEHFFEMTWPVAGQVDHCQERPAVAAMVAVGILEN